MSILTIQNSSKNYKRFRFNIQLITPLAALSTVSTSKTASLVGHQEFIESAIPKKYRTRTSNQLWWNNSFNGAGCSLGPYASTRIEVVDATSSYHITTGVKTVSGVRNYGGSAGFTNPPSDSQYVGSLTASDSVTNVDDSVASILALEDGFNAAVATALTVTKTTSESCFPNGPFSNIFTGGQKEWVLTDEDTEVDALARASASVGAAAIAKYEQRSSGQFSFLYVTVAFNIHLINLILTRDYRVVVDLVTETYGGGSPITTQRTYDFTASSTTHDINDSLIAVRGQQVTVQNPTITNL